MNKKYKYKMYGDFFTQILLKNIINRLQWVIF